ncbi:MAG: glutaredoxin family protein [Pseudomonadota bacterium]
MPELVLYSTRACHLCEQAEALLMPLVQRGVLIAVDDVSESDALFHRYGMRIPVLRHGPSGQELDWPFALPAVEALLG